jgi:hypothetical protein
MALHTRIDAVAPIAIISNVRTLDDPDDLIFGRGHHFSAIEPLGTPTASWFSFVGLRLMH